MKKGTRKKTAGTAAKRRTPTRKATPAGEDVHKFEAVRPGAPRRAKRKAHASGTDIDDLGELPRGYGDGRIFAVAQEPHWLFCYWDYTLTEGTPEQVFLRHTLDHGPAPENEVAVPHEANSWYLPVREADARYTVELGRYDGGQWIMLARSQTILTPRDTVAGLGDPVFANMPFHITFQQIVEKLRGKMRKGESLAEAMARLQKTDGMPTGRLNSAQRIALDTLLRTELGSLTSGDLGRMLSSHGASQFSGGFAPTSWGGGASWGTPPGSASGGFLEQMGLGSSPSWGGASWFGTVPGGWTSAGLASWGAPASPMPGWPNAPRDFFMHVNAEVIFYGGTHPDAKVTIDGKPVTLRPDGTFRCHFTLPDGEFEIPITATSPDGVETRRAVLKFERTTTRKGEVGSTAQPPLGEPMGRKK